MEVDLSPFSLSERGKASVTFGCNEFAPHNDAEEKDKDGGVSVASEEEEEEFDCPTRTHRRRRAIRRRQKTGPNSMSQAERAMYQQLLEEQEGTEQGRSLQGKAHGGGPQQEQGEWESRTIHPSGAFISVSPVGPEEDEANHRNSEQEQWAGSTLGGPCIGDPFSSSTQGHSSSSSPSSCLALPLASGSNPTVSFSPSRGRRPSSVRSGCSTGRWVPPHGGPNGSQRRAFVEPGPPEGDGGSESDWSEAERQEERHSRIASRRRTGPQQLSQEQIEEMNRLFAQKCT